jgi:alanine racemase
MNLGEHINFPKTRAEINLTALSRNLENLKSLCRNKKFMAVVKANAYGHGIEIVAAHLYKQGIRHFAVSNVAEADSIIGTVSGSDILILDATPPEFVEQVAKNKYIQTVIDVVHARRISEQAGNTPVRCHIKIDTGMSRFGISGLDELSEVMSLPGLKPEALFTHFSCSDSTDPSDAEFTVNQQSKLVEFAARYNLPFHSQNSGGVLYHSDFGGDMVRVGIALYGYRPNSSIESPVELSQVMSLKSSIAQIREIGAGVPVSYGRTYIAYSPGKLAVIPVGYADGYFRLLSGKGKVLINGQAAPIRGRVCMEYVIADITDTDSAKVGGEVEIYSDSHKETGIEHVAGLVGTIPYEITCAVSPRVPRVAVCE